jgi:hypothetical protein
MNTSAMHQFEPGKAYFVAHRDHTVEGVPRVSPRVLRIFKGMEQRFGDIPCAIFTAKVTRGTTATYDEATKTLTISGKRVPRSEVSVPHYDIMTAELATQH